METIIISLISILVTIYVTFPLFVEYQSDRSGIKGLITDNVNRKIMNLDSEKENIYSELRDIEFDYKLGKITDEDYRYLNKKYKLRAAGIIEEIEKLKRNG